MILATEYMNRDDEGSYFYNKGWTVKDFCLARKIRYNSFMRALKILIEHGFVEVKKTEYRIMRMELLSKDNLF